MRACHGNTTFLLCNLRVKIMVRYPYEVKFPEYYQGVLFHASHWNFCSLIGQSCSLLCSLHGRAQQNFNMTMRKKTMKMPVRIFSGQGDFPLDDLKQWSPIFLATRTGFTEDSSSTDQGWGRWFGDDSGTLHLSVICPSYKWGGAAINTNEVVSTLTCSVVWLRTPTLDSSLIPIDRFICVCLCCLAFLVVPSGMVDLRQVPLLVLSLEMQKSSVTFRRIFKLVTVISCPLTL